MDAYCRSLWPVPFSPGSCSDSLPPSRIQTHPRSRSRDDGTPDDVTKKGEAVPIAFTDYDRETALPRSLRERVGPLARPVHSQD